MLGKKSEDVYNSKLKNSTSGLQSSCRTLSKTRGYPCPTPNEFGGSSSKSDFKTSDFSTIGKVPIHGPRRPVLPSRLMRDEFEIERAKFKVSKSQIMNYKAICNLAGSRNSGYVYVVNYSLILFVYFFFFFSSIYLFLYKLLCLIFM